MNKKRKIYVLLKIILIVLLIYIYVEGGKKIYLSEIYECLVEVLGNFTSILILYLLLNVLSDFILDLNKRTVFLTRLNFFFVLLICLSNLQLLFYIEGLGKEELGKKIFVYLYVYKELGMLITMILYKFYFLVSINTNIIITGIILVFSLFILFGKIIGNVVRKAVKYSLKENREKRKKIRKLIIKEKEIKEKILRKEKCERVERKKQIIIEETKKKEIKEKILEFKNNMGKTKEISIGKQMNIIGIDLIDHNELKEEKRKKEDNVDGLEKVTEGQLYFKFKKKRCKDDISF